MSASEASAHQGLPLRQQTVLRGFVNLGLAELRTLVGWPSLRGEKGHEKMMNWQRGRNVRFRLSWTPACTRTGGPDTCGKVTSKRVVGLKIKLASLGICKTVDEYSSWLGVTVHTSASLKALRTSARLVSWEIAEVASRRRETNFIDIPKCRARADGTNIRQFETDEGTHRQRLPIFHTKRRQLVLHFAPSKRYCAFQARGATQWKPTLRSATPTVGHLLRG